jgi:hypothetical protein
MARAFSFLSEKDTGGKRRGRWLELEKLKK